MNEVATTLPAPDEAPVLARKLAESFGQMIQLYERHYSLSREEAVRRATEPPPDGGERILNAPPDQISFFDLFTIAQTDPGRAAACWEEIKRSALEELRSGHRAAAAAETSAAGAWRRAQFLALREELAAGWGPCNGIERQLIDILAQAQAGFLHWLETVTARTELESCTTDRRYREEGKWGPPRVSDAEALDQAAGMMERYNRMFLRTLRALCELRRRGGAVIVKDGGQVNVAQQQQVNVNTPPRKRKYNTRTGKTADGRSSGRAAGQPA